MEDWKGHHIANFGELLLEDIFLVTKSDVDREYHVFLFEKIILCCKEVPPNAQNGIKKPGKNNPLLKKQAAPAPLPLQGATQGSRRTTPLVLKGRIFLGNVTQAISVQPKTGGRNSVVMYLSTFSMIVQLPASQPIILCKFGGRVTMISNFSHCAVAEKIRCANGRLKLTS